MKWKMPFLTTAATTSIPPITYLQANTPDFTATQSRVEVFMFSQSPVLFMQTRMPALLQAKREEKVSWIAMLYEDNEIRKSKKYRIAWRHTPARQLCLPIFPVHTNSFRRGAHMDSGGLRAERSDCAGSRGQRRNFVSAAHGLAAQRLWR